MKEQNRKYTGTLILCICLCYLALPQSSFAQQQDSSRIAAQDTLVSPTPATPPPAGGSTKPPQAPSGVENVITFQSQDSLIIDFSTGKKAFLFGKAQVSHDSGQLDAGEINLDIDENLVEARTLTPEDTLSRPVLKQAEREIKSTYIRFNFDTQKGKFEAAQIQVQEGYLIGSKIKNISQDIVFIEDGIYSTCPPNYLYYYIKAKKMKVVDQDELFFTNARLYILDIPYPLVFPFGYVPTDIEKRRSGLLTPTYAFQAQSSRGIGLQNFGYFQYFNDYLTGQVDTDIYTSGTYFIDSQVQYRKLNKFNGSIAIGYSRERGLESTDPDFSRTVQRSLRVQHSQDFNPYSSISANINLRTADYFRRNSYDISDRAEVASNSKLAYNYTQPNNAFTFSTNAQLAQNFSQNSTNLTGPNANFRLRTFSPFQSSGGAPGQSSWYETINISYNNQLSSRFNYQPIDGDSADISFLDALSDPSLYREATGDNDYIRAGLRQTAAVQIGQLIPSNFVNLSAGINFNEYWFPTSTRRVFNPDSNRVETEKRYGFETARDYSLNMGLNTNFYGISNTKIGPFNGFKHTVRPSVSFSYRPDFSSDKFGYYRTVQTDTLGNTQRYSIFSNEIFNGPGSGEQRSLNFSLVNIFETKLIKRDSTGEVQERNLRLIDNLSASTSYNFAADSLNLNRLNTSISSNVIQGLNFRATANFSFYQLDSLGREINRFVWEDGSQLAKLRTFSVNASTSFRGGRRGGQVFTPVYRRQYDPFDQTLFSPVDPRFGYQPVDPMSSPWSFTLNFNYRWNFRFDQPAQKSAVINAQNISFQLTPKWRFSTQIGYDFIQKELTPSQFNLSRNLECWDLAFQVNPFGEFQYYFFRLTVNSQQIQNLFQKLPILKNLERQSSPSGRGFRYGG